MLSTDQINDLHRLCWSERWAIREIERHLKISGKTIRKYLQAPAQAPALRSRASKLDPFKGQISEWLEKDPGVTAAVIEQRLRPLGYNGGHSITEPPAGERFEVAGRGRQSTPASRDARAPLGPIQTRSVAAVADHSLRRSRIQGDAKVFKKYSQMKLQVKREALQKLNKKANEDHPGFDTEKQPIGFCHGRAWFGPI